MAPMASILEVEAVIGEWEDILAHNNN